MPNPENLQKLDSKKAAEIGAKGGRAKKGSKHISTHIQEMLNDENFELKLKDGSILRGRPMDAIIKTAIAKGVSGDMRAFDMLGKYGYGTNLDITSDGETIKAVTVVDLGNINATDKHEAESDSTDDKG